MYTATGAADAVHIIFVGGGKVVVDDVRYVVYVDTARRDVGRYEHLHLALFEAFERALALGVRFVAVNRIGCDAVAVELDAQFLHAVLHGAKNDDTREIFAY